MLFKQEIIPMISNAMKEDSDGDGYMDFEDENPLKKSHYNYIRTNILEYTPEYVECNKEKKESDENYGKGVYNWAEKNVLSNRWELMEKIMMAGFLFGDASRMLDHYLSNTGTDYNLNVKKLIDSSSKSDADDIFEDAIHKTQLYAEDILKKNSSIIFVSKAPFITHSKTSVWDISRNASVGDCSGCIVAKVSRFDNEYKMEYRYIVFDFYDWDSNNNDRFIAIAPSDKQIFELHYAGMAKQFYVYGEYRNEITWKK